MTTSRTGSETRRFWAVGVALAGLLASGPAHAVEGGRFGEVTLTEPRGEVRGVVILFSDRGGLGAVDHMAARTLADNGALVVEVDSDAYLDRLDREDESCHWPVGDAEKLSHRLQREHGYPRYFTPILAGRGQGGSLARVTLAQAPDATMAGAVSLDPAPAIAGRRPLCATVPASPAPGGGFGYGAVKTLPGFWTVGLSAAAPAAGRQDLAALRAAGMPVTLRPLSGPADAAALAGLVLPELAQPLPATGAIAALPLTPLPAGQPAAVMAVFLSGDGGWRDLDQSIAEQLRRDGVPVVGWDSLRYFWSKKTPERTAADLAAVLQAYLAKWQAGKVVLVGYSFGAGVLPFAYNRLPEALRSRIVLVALLGIDRRSDFEVSPTGWLGAPPSAAAVPVLPEIERMPAALVQCFQGKGEDDSVCPDLAPRGVEIISVPGGHHFDGDYATLARRIEGGLKQRGQ